MTPTTHIIGLPSICPTEGCNEVLQTTVKHPRLRKLECIRCGFTGWWYIKETWERE